MLVSIHAAQTGCDCSVFLAILVDVGFNSRSPSGLRLWIPAHLEVRFHVSIHAAQAGCDSLSIHLLIWRAVSIHAAQAGCDNCFMIIILRCRVSIHAAQAGCDLVLDNSRCTQRGFNSRSPSGLRPSKDGKASWSSWFQFTQPKRAATPLNLSKDCLYSVSIHAAQAGCDRIQGRDSEYGAEFQFTQPKRAATVAAKIQQKRASLKG